MKGLTVRLPAALLDALRSEAKTQTRSINGQVLQILQFALKLRLGANARSGHSEIENQQGRDPGSPEEARQESES